MAATTGTLGRVLVGTAVLYVTKWSLARETTTSRWADSSAAGYKQTIAGVKSMVATVEYKHDAANGALAGHVILEEGDTVALHLSITSATDYGWALTGVVKSNSVTVDIDDGTVIGGTAVIESKGSYSVGTP